MVFIEPVEPIPTPVRLLPSPEKLVAVITPAKLAPVFTSPTSCTLVTDILLLF